MPYLGLDIGTSAVKAVIVDDDEKVLAEGERPLVLSRPGPGLSEQDAQDWVGAVEAVLLAWRQDHGAVLAAVEGIGLSGQMHGAVCLGADDRPLRPVTLWNDSRAAAEAAELNRIHPDLAWRLGVPAAPGFAAPQLLWLSRHEPATLVALRKVLLPKDYVRLQLTGEHVTDMSDAAGSWWLDEAARDWSDAALAATAVSRSVMPRLVEGTAVSGSLTVSAATRLGLRPGIPVAGGAGDAMAGAVGIGAIDDGAFISLGTSSQFFAPGRQYRPLPDKFLHAFCHAVPGCWIQMAALLNGASCLAWLAALVGTPIETLLAEVAAQPPGPGAVTFLPYLAGERTPHNDAAASGVFSGMTGATGRSDLARSVLEGVAYSLADAADCLAEAGTQLQDVAVIGGGARSALWVQIIADVLGRPLKRYRGGEKGPAFGAARLARAAACGADIRTLAPAPPVLDVAEPRPDLTAAYAERIAAFRRLYQATKAAR
ncbi:xylulokinase [Labrys monachus]|uniref:Xylulose kinase n=1 Tax=Labrys monachus TaxID=217067 RepID=A0ABU0FMB2_9HYPH|nr:xylulokinase [Labrys monachus]MDQ0395611.1 xylulokinase [Labrys monachus]